MVKAAESHVGAGSLMIIGGREDKRGDRAILRQLAASLDGRPLVVATVATAHPEEVWQEYRQVFTDLGVRALTHLHIAHRDEAFSAERLALVEDAGAVFFSGGDQLRITSRIGGAPLCDRIRELLGRGGIVAGTSAGASALSEVMLVSGPSDQSHRSDSLQMSPGLGLLGGVIIDQHFAERGRMGRLVGAVAQNPRLLGIGIDEDTAVIAEGQRLRVIGSGAASIVDGMRETFTNVSEEEPGSVVSVFDLRLHILGAGDTFDLQTRRPASGAAPEPGGAPDNG